ncbi:hypothetical protein NP233_g8124 [Leucocoprinus birnbaumii]|uniref:Cytochrome P450 n=1 Tax=Leucocoprinus birnbaumii TaxID=56174 RepID=A0AAD5YPC4_9AGAR|nr:hypothetical protein NP233_g8124 [Leucocoprinus birnbaumii]
MPDLLSTWSIALATSLVCGITAFLRLRQPKHPKNPFPAGPKPKPLLGNMLDMVASEPWLMYMKWAERYQSKILSLALPGTSKRMVILNSAEDAIELLEKRAAIYSDRTQIPLIEMTGWTFNTGLMRNNERWRAERKIFVQNFRRESVGRYMPIQTTKVHAMLRQLLSDPEGFADHYKTLSAAIVLEIMYGYEPRPKNDNMVQVVERAVAQIIENSSSPSIVALNVFPSIRHLPRWFPGTGFHKIVDDCREFTRDMLDIPFEYVRSSMKEGSTKSSIVRSLLESKVIGEESVKGIAGTAFSAGTDTVVSVIECFFFAMSLHPTIQRKAQQQIDNLIGSENRLPTFADRDSLPYIDAILRETLRWLPPFPMSVPHVVEEDDVYKGYFIPKGSIIYPNVWAMTHDESQYDDPETFIPERFIDANGGLRDNMRTPLAFGFGRRLCPGQYLGANTVWLSIATVLASFDIGLPYDLAGNRIEFQQVYTKADSLHMKPYKCSITPRSDAARKLVEATEYITGDNALSERHEASVSVPIPSILATVTSHLVDQTRRRQTYIDRLFSHHAHTKWSSVSTPSTPAPTRTTYAPTSLNANASATTAVPVPPQLEQTLSTLTSHRSVLGYLLIARGESHSPGSASIIRHSGVVFEGEKGRKYASVIARIVENVQAGLEEVNNGGEEMDEVRFMRIRTKRHEIMISPDERFLLAVLHDPTVS